MKAIVNIEVKYVNKYKSIEALEQKVVAALLHNAAVQGDMCEQDVEFWLHDSEGVPENVSIEVVARMKSIITVVHVSTACRQVDEIFDAMAAQITKESE